MTDEELKPCPFCGGEPRVWKLRKKIVSCSNDKCGAYFSFNGFTPEEWNTRAEPQAVDVEGLKMDEEKIFENLCMRDERSPYYHYDEDIDEEKPVARRDGCGCDNCFYGRDKLALEILRLKKDTRAEPQAVDGASTASLQQDEHDQIEQTILARMAEREQVEIPDDEPIAVRAEKPRAISVDELSDAEMDAIARAEVPDNAEALEAWHRVMGHVQRNTASWVNEETREEVYEDLRTIRAALEEKNDA